MRGFSSHRLPRRASFIAIVCVGIAVAANAARAEDPAFSDLPPALLERLGKSQTAQQLTERLLQELRQADIDGNGLDRADLDLAAQIEQAQARAALLGRTLGYDLDNDGVVTRDEVARVAAYQSQRNNASKDRLQKYVDKMVEQVMQADRDGDGQIATAELLRQDAGAGNVNRRTARALGLLDLDQDNDGRVTESEITDVAQRTFQAVDYNGDGTLSSEEAKLLAPARSLAQAIRNAGPCDLPPAGGDDQVIVFGAYNGSYQPTVTIAGQDTATTLMRLEIEPGDTPLYLVLEAQFPTIWQLDGAVERVARAVVLPGYAGGKGDKAPGGGAGIIGLPQDKVTFPTAASCGKSYHDPTSQPGQVRARVVEKATGRSPVTALGVYSANIVRLPSGEPVNVAAGNRRVDTSGSDLIIVMPTPSASTAGKKWKDNEDRFADPANIVAVDPAEVIAPVPAQTYEVLPNQYGLRQLVEEGKLERTNDGYRIVKPIPRFPPGLTGAHYAAFILPQGMPMPAGDSGHSEIILEQPAQ